jgi:hypothetical protein
MEQNRFWKANSSSASQKISRVLWKSEVHYHIYKSYPPVPILSQINPVRASHPTSWRSVVILSSHQCQGFQTGLFPSGFPTISLYVHIHSLIPNTCSARLVYLGLITPRIYGEEYRSLRSSLCSLIHSPVTLRPNTFLSILFPGTISPCSSVCETQFRTHTNQETKLQLCIPLIFMFGEQCGRRKIPHRLITNNSWSHSALNCFRNGILIC